MPNPLRTISYRLAAVYGLVVIIVYVLNPDVRELIQAYWWAVAAIFGALVLVGGCSTPPPLELGEEYEPADERTTIAQIVALLLGRLRVQYLGKPVLRDTHPKSNGLVKAVFRIKEEIKIDDVYRQRFQGLRPEDLRIGLFAEPGREYEAWVRLSNSEDEVTHDRSAEFRGVAVKIFEVPGEKLIGDEAGTFDLLFIGHDAFFAANPRDFLRFFAARTYFRSWPLGGIIARLVYLWIQPRGALNGVVGQNQMANPLKVDWFSVAPFLLGNWPDEDRFPDAVRGRPRAVKYRLRPWPKPKKSETRIPPEPLGYDYLREAVTKTLENGARFDVLMQIQTRANRQLIESTARSWKARHSPWIHVATLEMPPQSDVFNTDERQAFDENLVYNPWHCLPEHRPLGGVNRARRDVMHAIQSFRLKQNERERTDVTTQSPEDVVVPTPK